MMGGSWRISDPCTLADGRFDGASEAPAGAACADAIFGTTKQRIEPLIA
jgi:hypothetical protein